MQPFWRQFIRGRRPPDFWTAYEAHFPTAYSLSTPVEELRFVVFDTETTGLDPRRDQLLSIGAVVVRDWQLAVEPTFECFIPAPADRPPSSESIAVHGILPGEHEHDISLASALEQFLAYIGDAVLVAHQINFDLTVIQRALRRVGGGSLHNYQLDTVRLAERVQPSGYWTVAGAYSLDSLAQRYNIPLSDRHTAVGDAYITAILFMKLLGRLRQRGVITLKDLLR